MTDPIKTQMTEARWQSLAENASSIFLIVGRDEKVQYINRTITKRTREEVIGMDVYDIVPPDFKLVIKENIAKVFKTGEPSRYETSGIGPNNTVAWYETKVNPIKEGDEITAVALISINVTELRVIQKKAEESEKRYRSFFEGASEAMLLLDIRGKILDINSTFLDMAGYKKEEAVGKNILEFVSKFGLDKGAVLNVIKDVIIGTRKGRHEWIIDDIKNKGQKINLIGSNTIIKDDDGTKILATFSNITDFRKTQKKLEESEDNFKILFDNANDEVVILDRKGTVLNVNKKVREIFGYEEEEVIGKNFTQIGIIHLKDIPRLMKLLVEFDENTPKLFELEAKKKDGTPIFFETSTGFIKKDNKIEKIFTIIRDITERKKNEEKIKKAYEDLARKNNELEGFNQGLLDREERIMELKTQVKELEEKLKSKE